MNAISLTLHVTHYFQEQEVMSVTERSFKLIKVEKLKWPELFALSNQSFPLKVRCKHDVRMSTMLNLPWALLIVH